MIWYYTSYVQLHDNGDKEFKGGVYHQLEDLGCEDFRRMITVDGNKFETANIAVEDESCLPPEEYRNRLLSFDELAELNGGKENLLVLEAGNEEATIVPYPEYVATDNETAEE